jgi:heme/copper-type cytochrome/quinol oxidase subunit 3
MSERYEQPRGHAQPERPRPKEPVAAGAALDVSALPTFGFGQRSPMWWATLGLIAIESTVFALAIMSYFYLRSHASVWPMTGMPPDLLWGTLNTVILVLSMVPNQLAKKASERMDLPQVRLWMVLCMLVSIAFLVVRGFEFAALNTRWDSDAYGSIVWMLLGLHTTHLVTDAYDSGVLTVLMFTGPLEGKRFVDVSENATYWYFVVLSWLPIYATIYFGARY